MLILVLQCTFSLKTNQGNLQKSSFRNMRDNDIHFHIILNINIYTPWLSNLTNAYYYMNITQM